MRKKVEKYLASKLGVDETQVKPREDGRYDGMSNDIDNLLRAVRESEPSSRGSSQSKRAKLNAAGSSTSARRMGFFPYQSLATYANYLSTGENAVVPSGSWTSWSGQTPSPYITAPQTPPGEKKPLSSECLSARKSIFDETSPSFLGGSLEERLGSSPALCKMQGMTPASTFGESCTTPFPSDTQMKLSPEEAESLNKTLFSEGVMTPFPKTPMWNREHRTEPIRFRIGTDDGKQQANIKNMRIGNRVPISPISEKKGERGRFHDEIEHLASSFGGHGAAGFEEGRREDDKEIMPPPKFGVEEPTELSSAAKLFHDKTPKRDIELLRAPPSSIDADKLLKDLETETPATTQTEAMGESFWDDHHRQSDISPVPMSLTPASRAVKASDNVDSTGSKRLSSVINEEKVDGTEDSPSPSKCLKARNDDQTEEENPTGYSLSVNA